MLVVGIDFGTLSARAVVVRVSDGAELGSAAVDYAHGVLEPEPQWALQVPSDYLDALRAVPLALREAGASPSDVIGIGTDFTASTVLPVLEDGTPLSSVSSSPHALAKLWRHHAASSQATRFNAVFAAEQWMERYGGLTSAEWEFPKALQVLEEAPDVYAQMRYWVEAADWIVWQLTGTHVRNACTAGYKGLYQSGYPAPALLASLHPDFGSFAAQKLDAPIVPLGTRVGGLSAAGAALTGLREGTPVACGVIDAHATVAAAGAASPGQLVAVMGTSTCHMMVGSSLRPVPGMCGVVDGGIVPGHWGYEAGQSGAGSILAWYVEHQVPASYSSLAAEQGISVHTLLSRLGDGRPVGSHGLIALDWHDGNRSLLVDHALSGLVLGQTLATRAEDIYRALMEATAFGTRTIVTAFRDAGLPVESFVAAGGLTQNPVLMQIYADVLGMPVSLIGSSEGAALGAAIHGAVAAGAHPSIPDASVAMGSVRRDVYIPDAARVSDYTRLYAEYVMLHDHFGRGGNSVMHRLRSFNTSSTAGDTSC
ncbi:ribulokinase [Lentzea sp. NPDC006480]|uniref:ribulokinase n=1 Tax=Lentzea sp. NPDC006480 TaxID=3157176 RepID=UPI0033A1CF5C